MTNDSFRVLDMDDLDAAYAIVEEVTNWLLRKGVRQWLQPLPYEVYRERQQRRENFGLFIEGDLAAVVSMMPDRPEYWADYLPESGFRWLATLASSRRYKGQSLGQRLIECAEITLAREGIEEIYLDCMYGDGILPQYYELLGFDQIAREILSFPFGEFDGVLMRKSLAATAAIS